LSTVHFSEIYSYYNSFWSTAHEHGSVTVANAGLGEKETVEV